MFVLVRESGLFGKEAIQQVGFTNVGRDFAPEEISTKLARGRGTLLPKQLFINFQKPLEKGGFDSLQE